MKHVPVFNGSVTKGNLSVEGRYYKYLLSLEGAVEVIVRKPKKGRSIRQNSYYFGIIVSMISEETGHEPDEIHEILKSMFLTQHTEIMGIGADYVKSTTSLSTVEMEDYLSKCRQFGSLTQGIFIPLPNEVMM